MALKKQYQVYVDEMIKHGDEILAYKKAYPKAKNHDGIRKGCLRMSQNATIQSLIKAEADKRRAVAEQQAILELKDEIKANILTRQEKLEILRKIAFGELQIPVKKPVWDKKESKYVFVPIVELPDHAARLKAIEVDNKMNGDNSADKWEGEFKKPIPFTNDSAVEIDYSKLSNDVLKAIMVAGKKPNE